jgi:hypothetical protein
VKVIFLDIDGVCNNWNTIAAKSFLEPKLVDKVWEIAERTNAKIVISSAWRSFRSIDNLRHLFSQSGVDTNLIIDKTPDYGGKFKFRWVEIAAWLKEHNKKVDAFVILDDIEDFDILAPHHVCCSMRYGLTRRGVEKAVKILNSGWMVELEKKEDVA